MHGYGYGCFRFDHEVRKSFSIHPKDISRKNEWFSAGPAVVGPPELKGTWGVTGPHQNLADTFYSNPRWEYYYAKYKVFVPIKFFDIPTPLCCDTCFHKYTHMVYCHTKIQCYYKSRKYSLFQYFNSYRFNLTGHFNPWIKFHVFWDTKLFVTSKFLCAIQGYLLHFGIKL